MRGIKITTVAVLIFLAGSLPAAAYVGPGAGLSLIGALWGLLLAVAAAVGYVVLWPLRRLTKRFRAKNKSQ